MVAYLKLGKYTKFAVPLMFGGYKACKEDKAVHSSGLTVYMAQMAGLDVKNGQQTPVNPLGSASNEAVAVMTQDGRTSENKI